MLRGNSPVEFKLKGSTCTSEKPIFQQYILRPASTIRDLEYNDIYSIVCMKHPRQCCNSAQEQLNEIGVNARRRDLYSGLHDTQ